MMIAFAVMSVLVGAALGARFKVLVLLPGVLIGTALTIGMGIVQGDSPVAIMLAALLQVMVFQSGYFTGAVFSAQGEYKNTPETVASPQRFVS
jgi:hypothetical protein